MRKPDRFERMVAQEGKRIKGLSAALLDPMFTIKLLRRQHRAMVRVVKAEYTHWAAIASDKKSSLGSSTYAHYRALQCRDAITLLDDYKR